jgi:hypothetical protein
VIKMMVEASGYMTVDGRTNPGSGWYKGLVPRAHRSKFRGKTDPA